MRHGYEWWEAFWKDLKEKAIKEDLKHDFGLENWLKNRYKVFEELWRKNKIILPPIRRDEK